MYAACVTANVPLIEVLSNEVVPATVKLSDNVAACVTANVPLIEVLSNEVMPVTVKLSDMQQRLLNSNHFLQCHLL